MKTCEDCLFYVDTLPDIVVCIGHKRVKEYAEIQKNCKVWVEDTPENAKEWLDKNKEDEK